MRRISALALALAFLFAGTRTAAAGNVDPALRFHTLTTPHFYIYFHQGEERSARRLAAIAEDTWSKLQRPLDVPLPGKTHVVLVDQTELANGSAIPVPYNTIFVTATWPAGSDFIGRTDDWLQLVFTHEYTHILHLDRSGGWARAVRSVFGRVPIAFPNLFLPLWQIEGLAVYEESILTGEGRLHAGDFRAIEQTARREHAMEPIDRVNGGLTDWPGGTAAYAYGAPFHQFLADRYGPETLANLANATSRSLPYTGSSAFKDVYGKGLSELWRDFEAQPADAPPPAPVDDHALQITHHGFTVSGPRFAAPRCPGCASDIIYALRTPDAFPTLNAIAPDGTDDRVLTSRYLGSTSGTNPGVIVFDQQDYHRSTSLFSDLYVLDWNTGAVQRLTNGSRLLDPDLSPDGRRIVCVKAGPGQRDLVVAELTVVAQGFSPAVTRLLTLISEPDTQFEAPRWSPDGRSIVVARHRLGGESEIVVVNADSAAVTVVASDASARFVTPTWRPDGLSVVAAADFGEGVFDLYDFDLAQTRPPLQLTHTLGGATWPDISRDGRTMVYVGYTKDGFDLFVRDVAQGFSPADAAGPSSFAKATEDKKVRTTSSYDDAIAAPYSPLQTLKPTSWMPYIENRADQLRFGATLGGYDVLGYHGYALSATWLIAGPAGAKTPNAATPDWQAEYVYSRWRPSFFALAARTTTFFAGPPSDAGTPTNTTSREYQLEAGVQLPVVHARNWQIFYASVFRAAATYDFPEGTASLNRTTLRAGWEGSTSHKYGYSISPEDGVTVGATVESGPHILGSYADANTVTADARAYLHGFAPHHVWAIRAAAGASSGSNITGRTFLSGGASPAAAPLSFDSRAMSLLRGFPADTFAGSHITVINTDYRFPIARPERGHGTFPLFLSMVHGAVFADAANTWTRAFRASNVKTSAGLELSADVVAGYVLPLTVTLGAAVGHDGAHHVPDNAIVYFRVGRAF